MRVASAVVLACVVLGGTATAGPMMPLGSSPESGLAGIWRFIEARPAPWAKPHSLTKADAPLLEYAIEFAEGAVKGPQPISCASAEYSSGVTYSGEAFGGRIVGAEIAARAKQAHLGDGGLTTFRVVCGTVVRDFYVDERADLVVAEGDVLYTLERPTGMDPQQFTLGYSGPSFDCAGAKTTADRVICIDAGLAKSDRVMGEAYTKLKVAESAVSFATVQKAQRAWLDFIIKSCVGDAPMPETLGDRNVIVNCLSPAYDDRADELSGLSVEKAGTLVLEPRARFRARAKPWVEESDVYPWMSGAPQAEAFNAFIARTYALSRWRTDAKGAFPSDSDDDTRYYARRSYSVARFDARIVSFQILTTDYAGGNHEARDQAALTWDVAKQRQVMLDDVFKKGGRWKATVADYCKTELHKQFAERQLQEDLSDEEIAATINNSKAWLWGAQKATVVFMIGLIGGMPVGELDVDIPLSALSPFMLDGAAVR